MMKSSDGTIPSAAAGQAAETVINPLPRVAIQAFCDTQELAVLIQSAAADRRAEKAHIKVQMGGLPAAVEAYRNAPTPNIILVEVDGERTAILRYLDELSGYCDSGTKVLVIGHTNDVVLYRELMRRGVSEYLLLPMTPLDIVRGMSEVFSQPAAEPLGRTIAVIGAKGGVGASTVAHNLAWNISRFIGLDTVIVDMDLPFGTAGLNFNQDPAQGISDAVFSPERLDANMIDRLLTKCSDHLSILAAPATLERAYDLHEASFDPVYEILRGAVPVIVLDVPHVWSAWSKRALASADEIVIVAAPDLANLRNAKNISDSLRQIRVNDSMPRLVINTAGMQKRPEIATVEFAKALELEAIASIPFDANLFGTAANNGQMIAEIQAKGKITEMFTSMARSVTGRNEARAERKSFMAPILARLKMRKA